jgi:hypothetical protein
VVQSIAVQKPFMVLGNVPIADTGDLYQFAFSELDIMIKPILFGVGHEKSDFL